MAFDLDTALWDEFLRVWPIERLRQMTLAQYTTAGDKECFVYWMETRLDGYGGISGGSAFKFGIYARGVSTHSDGDAARIYDGQYGWYRKLGQTSAEAFETVRNEVVAVAEAARDGRLEAIDVSPLGEAYRWKIAFLYQSRLTPQIVCVYVRKPLLGFLALTSGRRTLPQSQLYRKIAAQRPEGESIVAFSRRLWFEWARNNQYVVKLTQGALQNGYLTLNLVSAPFPESMHGGRDDADLGESAQFRTDTGLEFESDIRASSETSGRLRKRLSGYFSDAGLEAGDAVYISPEAEGRYLISRRATAAPPTRSAIDPAIADRTFPMSKPPLNQILFGPPGTGKTYGTVDHAVAILAPEFHAAHSGSAGRKAIKQRFDELVKERRVRFVTFHQSFSYEDFVEGLRAENDAEGKLHYRIVPGVFKSLCDDARGSAQVASAVGIAYGARIWKISIDGTAISPTRDYCFKHGEARIGWGTLGDLRDDLLPESGGYQQLGSNDRNTLETFSSEMQIGDVLLCIGSVREIQAIGVVQGEYSYEEKTPSGVRSDYRNVRSVRWLATGLKLNLSALNDNRGFTLKTVYELGRFGWPELAKVIEDAGIVLDAGIGASAREPQDHVLIIDEINRGNVSRIFGELITLIEPSKRAGAADQLEVVLPYSKLPFSVPDNVYLIGTMNTTDRSLAGMDIALRRRFQFKEMQASSDALRGVAIDGIDLAALLERINLRIEALLDREHAIGHAYFMPLRNGDDLSLLASIFRNQILPLLQEYFFEDWQRIAWVLNDHRKASEHCFVRFDALDKDVLFGAQAEASVANGVWRINPGAFEKRESYLGIVEAIEA